MLQLRSNRVVSRRALISGLAATSALLVASCAGAPAAPTAAPAQPTQPAAAKTAAETAGQPKAGAGGTDWQRFKGKELRWMVLSAPWVDMLKANLGEFEQMTGIKVKIDSETWIEKLLPILTAGSDEVDFFMSNKGTYGLRFSDAGWYDNMDDWVKAYDRDVELNDFAKSALDTCRINGKLVGMPTWADHNFYYYRKDLFAQAGIAPLDPGKPITLEQFADNMVKLTKRDKEQYGVVTRGGARALIPMWISWLTVYGGSWKDASGKWALNTPAAVKSFIEYGRMLREWGPPGITEQTDLDQLYCQGKAASYINTVVTTPNMKDANKCGQAAQTEVSVMPGGRPYFFSWYMAISPFTKNKEAAFYFIQWASGKKNNARTLMQGLPPVRDSAWEDPDFKKSEAATKNHALHAAQRASIAGGVADWLPWVNQVLDARDAIGAVVLKAAGGASQTEVQQAADALIKQMEEIEKRK